MRVVILIMHFFWTMMKKDGGGEPKGRVAEEIKKNVQ